MSNKPTLSKILNHLDKDEIISKVIMGTSSKDIHAWLAAKYCAPAEKRFVLSEKMITAFKDNYLDVYTMIQEDIQKTKQSLSSNNTEDLELSVKNNLTYKTRMQELAKNEIDVRKMIAHLCLAVEIRLGQIFDEIESSNNLDTRKERVFLECAETFGNLLEKYYKFTENPADLTIQHNVTLQVVDQHIAVFHEAIREVLAEMDLESSMLFMELFQNKMAKLKPAPLEVVPNTDMKLAEAKLLNETINKRLNE